MAGFHLAVGKLVAELDYHVEIAELLEDYTGAVEGVGVLGSGGNVDAGDVAFWQGCASLPGDGLLHAPRHATNKKP